MRIQASAGRHKYLDEWCQRLTLTVDGRIDSESALESELLNRLRREFVNGNQGYLLRMLRKWQKSDDNQEIDVKVRP